MRAFLFLLIIGALLLAPFVAIKRPWAMRMWERVKLLVVVYVVAVFATAIFWLITRWDEFYG